MRKFLVISLLMFSVSMSAQQLIAVSAKTTQGISWTVGEMVVESIIGSDFASIQGFNHPQGPIPSFDGQVGIEVVESILELNVYPNPVINELTVDCKEGDTYFLKLTNLLGQEIILGHSFATSTTINMGNCAPGNYLLTVVSNQDFKSIIIIKK